MLLLKAQGNKKKKARIPVAATGFKSLVGTLLQRESAPPTKYVVKKKTFLTFLNSLEPSKETLMNK